MNDNGKCDPSRREFIQFASAGAGALTILRTVPAGAQVANAKGDARPDTADAGLGWETPDPSVHPDVQEGHQTLNLDGIWSAVALPLEAEGEEGYRAFANHTGNSLAVQVPGEIHLDLMRAGQMEDPNISDNARRRCRWPEQHSWWYRTEFTPPPGFREHWHQHLLFEGIDLFGQVFVNGTLAGTAKNAFHTHEFDVGSLLRDGPNELVVRVTSGMELAPASPPVPFDMPNTPPEVLSLYAVRMFDRYRFLRKPAYAAAGWDWCDPLPNIGIWRGVRLEGRSQVVIHHVRLDTVIQTNQVALEGEVILENLHLWSEIPAILELRLDPPEGESLVQRIALGTQIGHSPVPCRMIIPDPQLWWPNGMGAQPLYRLTIRVLCGNRETDRRLQTIGLRTIELDRSPLPEGERFCFKVNGHRVFCKGGNWEPADLIQPRIEVSRYEKFVTEAKIAHFNMLRVNGVGIYESDAFYEACNRAGILVWQDFTFTAEAQYPDQDSEFLALVRHEAQTIVKRLRHHPSLAMWCGNNECSWSMPNWKCDPAKPELCGGVEIYNKVLPDICHAYDPGRAYWPSSPFGGTEPNSETAGDNHWYGPPDDILGPADKRMSQEATDRFRGRFVSEYGVIGPPNMASIREYLKPEEVSFDSTAWKIHTNEVDAWLRDGTSAGIHNHYGIPGPLSVAQFVLYGQMFQAQLQGRAVDAMRFRKNDPKDDCQGVLVWSYNDCWGEVGWSIMDHYLRRKASYYWFKRSAAPVKVLIRSRGDYLVTRVVNDTRKSYRAVVEYGWMRLDGRSRELQKRGVVIPANGMIEVTRAPMPSSAQRDPREWLYAATLTGEGIAQDQAFWLMATHRELRLAEPVISSTVKDDLLEVSSAVYCHGVHFEDEGREVLADNYFDLLPGVSRQIPITTPTPSGTYPLTAVMPYLKSEARAYSGSA